MAIIKIGAPLADAPNVFAAPVINQLLALAVDCNHGYRIGGGVVKKGSLWNIGGVMFIADSDTAILGSKNQGLSNCAMAIKFSVSGNEATATYVSNLAGVSWNGEYQGNYDASGNMYYYKCKKDVFSATGTGGLYLDADPTWRFVETTYKEAWKPIKDGYRIKIEHTGSYNFHFILKLGYAMDYMINGTVVRTDESAGGNNVYTPFFLEEGDVFSVRTQVDAAPVYGYWMTGGLCNDTFGAHLAGR